MSLAARTAFSWRPFELQSTRAALIGEPASVKLLIAGTTVGALAIVAVSVPTVVDVLANRPLALLAFCLVTIALAATPVEVYGRGSFTFAGAGLLATAFTLGIGAAAIASFLVALVTVLRSRGLLHRAVFNAGTLALSSAVGGLVFATFDGRHADGWLRFFAAVCAGGGFLAVNIFLLSTAMGASEGLNPLVVWRERFRWLTPYYLASGALGLAISLGYTTMGIGGLAAFALPPAFMMLSIRQYLDRTRESVEVVRRANGDLEELLQFAHGLSASSSDAASLRAYAEEWLAELTCAPVRIVEEPSARGLPLLGGGQTVAWLEVAPTGDGSERWARIRETLLPSLGTALESAILADRVRAANRSLVAALSKSLEAKDLYTGGHTERVADIAMALASRLGYAGDELEAIQIGALVHDIGKIGVPEAILEKPGPLNEDEWRVMRQHPLVSDSILSETDVHPIVRQCARWSHERIDGSGYPDGLAGDEIPLPARIILVADAWDALTSTRPYRPGRDGRIALSEIEAHTGRQFCPVVVAELRALYSLEPEILALPNDAAETQLAEPEGYGATEPHGRGRTVPDTAPV